MAEQTTSSITVSASRSAVMQVIADFDSYPVWARGMKSARVVEIDEDGQAKLVAFELEQSPISDHYTLAYTWDGDHAVSWTLAEGKTMKAIDGSYQLSGNGDSTLVTYRLSVDVALPLIGMLRRKAEKVIIDSALKGLKERVESLS